MSLDDRIKNDKPLPKNGLSTVLRQIELYRVPIKVQGELRSLIHEYHRIYAEEHVKARAKHPTFTMTALAALANVYAEKAFGQYLSEQYGDDDVRK
jgi:hypothetical protein